jgi:hypothetical protein
MQARVVAPEERVELAEAELARPLRKEDVELFEEGIGEAAEAAKF